MINGDLDQFLDTGWFTEATLFYNGYIYWCEGLRNSETGIMDFFVNKWEVENEDDTYYHTIIEKDGSMKWETVFEIEHKDMDFIKKQFLEAPIFDGKSFWQVEKRLAWLDDGGNVTRK